MNRNRPHSGQGQLQLGELDKQAIAHSTRLGQQIIDEIEKQGGKIPFAHFMTLVLHAPGLGYYSAGAHKIGAAGDFITAPEISPLFSRCIARQCRQVMDGNDGMDILEVGAGSGAMASEILQELERQGGLPRHYYILDLSADLRKRQHARLQQEVPQLLARVVWLDTLPESGFNGVILANELLDAMPVHLIRFDPQNPVERYVAWDSGRFVWCDGALSDIRLADAVSRIISARGSEGFSSDYVSEINLVAADWVRTIAATLQRGLVLLIDYGYPQHEYYHPERHSGTVMCHYRHQVHSDPLILPGLQDVTAHVDFTAIAESAVGAGLDVAGYTSQAHFLLGVGLLEVLTEANETVSEVQQVMQTQAVKRVTLPEGMGELFKVMALSRGIEPGLIGFSMLDARRRL